ncbi:class II aldolase/adducin family protein [Roseateles depolymerans]|uniref:Fuculose phosphate aldolase n=1 Tax=Roseateles depolymerans TaxID=76731 RepID=A0A0U3ME26_9BURK|nr:class II aldolase/adducin family protein [Roseateles depolymerans]ALV06909.1 fuculose phosphate aldolase [Roseateles depolymerans]REG19889.1 L-fuculose-phosphate aldolase [Roseateles depolymerans]
MMHASTRQAVVALCLRLSERGYFAGTGGNLMLRIDDVLVAVTPSATDYLTMAPEDVCLLRLADLGVVDGERPPSVETGLHARVMRARPDVGCTIHTHQPLASACALIGEPLEVPRSQHAVLGRTVPVVGYAPSGTGWLAGKLAAAVRPDRQAWLLRNHGIVCCGRDSTAALEAVEQLEQLARGHLAARIERQMQQQPGSRAQLAALRQLLLSSKELS